MKQITIEEYGILIEIYALDPKYEDMWNGGNITHYLNICPSLPVNCLSKVILKYKIHHKFIIHKRTYMINCITGNNGIDILKLYTYPQQKTIIAMVFNIWGVNIVSIDTDLLVYMLEFITLKNKFYMRVYLMIPKNHHNMLIINNRFKYLHYIKSLRAAWVLSCITF